LPIPILLAIVVPPGVGILVTVINQIVHSWTDKGVLIDARGTGDPRILKDGDLPYGTVVILSRDGDKTTRTDLTDEKLSDYIAGAVGALTGGDRHPRRMRRARRRRTTGADPALKPEPLRVRRRSS
jgi:hypothetical protein